MKISPKNTKVCSSCSKGINTEFNAPFKISNPETKNSKSSKIVSIVNTSRQARSSKKTSLF